MGGPSGGRLFGAVGLAVILIIRMLMILVMIVIVVVTVVTAHGLRPLPEGPLPTPKPRLSATPRSVFLGLGGSRPALAPHLGFGVGRSVREAEGLLSRLAPRGVALSRGLPTRCSQLRLQVCLLCMSACMHLNTCTMYMWHVHLGYCTHVWPTYQQCP